MAEMTIDHGHATSPEAVAKSNDNQKFAMWLYLASEVVIFSVMIVGYIIFRINEPAAVRVIQQELGIALVSANTFILLASSWAMVMGLMQMQRGNRRGMMTWIGITALMGTMFLGGQYIEYQELSHLEIALQRTVFEISDEGALEGEAPVTEGDHGEISELVERIQALDLTNEEKADILDGVGNFGMRFYAPTAFHGAHVLVGVLWALLVLFRGSKGRYDSNPVGIEIFGLYWHFVDVVWILLFTFIYLI